MSMWPIGFSLLIYRQKETLLHVAAYKGFNCIVKLLIAAGANVNAKDV